MRWTGIVVAAASLGGCISTAKTVVTAPFRVAGKAVDWTTTSQEESDRNRGRAARKADKHEAKERRRARDEDRKDN